MWGTIPFIAFNTSYLGTSGSFALLCFQHSASNVEAFIFPLRLCPEENSIAWLFSRFIQRPLPRFERGGHNGFNYDLITLNSLLAAGFRLVFFSLVSAENGDQFVGPNKWRKAG